MRSTPPSLSCVNHSPILPYLLLAAERGKTVGGKGEHLVLSGIDMYRRDEADVVPQAAHHVVRVGHASREQDGVHPAAQHGRGAANPLCYRVNHAVHHQLGLPVAGLYGLDYGAHVGAAQVGGQPGVAADAALQLLARVAPREAEVDERTRRQRTRAFGREGSLAVEGVVDVDAAAVAVRAYGDAAAQMGDYQVQGFVGGAVLAGVTAGYGALVQGVPGADARQQR